MFIKLHQDNDGQVVLLNLDQIRAIKPATNKDNDVVSRIVFEDGEELLVEESFSSIHVALERMKANG